MDYAEANATVSWNHLVESNYWSMRLIGASIGGRDLPIASK